MPNNTRNNEIKVRLLEYMYVSKKLPHVSFLHMYMLLKAYIESKYGCNLIIILLHYFYLFQIRIGYTVFMVFFFHEKKCNFIQVKETKLHYVGVSRSTTSQGCTIWIKEYKKIKFQKKSTKFSQ